jgi:TM2 domain-containing membrane protein YozV
MATLLKLYLTCGLLGLHRLYTDEPDVALLYLMSGGLLGLGTLSDAFQLAYLLDRSNHPEAYDRYSLFTAYQLLIPPFGLLGLHQRYIGKTGLGWFYAATAGLLGIGLLYDVCTLPQQVREANARYAADRQQQQRLVATGPPLTPDELSSLSSSSSSSLQSRGKVVYAAPRCVACLRAAINSVFLNCGHSVFCLDCAKSFVDSRRREGDGARQAEQAGAASGSSSSSVWPLASSTLTLPCPICRAPVREIKQIYVSSSS